MGNMMINYIATYSAGAHIYGYQEELAKIRTLRQQSDFYPIHGHFKLFDQRQ
jgi:hypothetical protein